MQNCTKIVYSLFLSSFSLFIFILYKNYLFFVVFNVLLPCFSLFNDNFNNLSIITRHNRCKRININIPCQNQILWAFVRFLLSGVSICPVSICPWIQKSTGIDMEQNYVTVALCVWCVIFRRLARNTLKQLVPCVAARIFWRLSYSSPPFCIFVPRCRLILWLFDSCSVHVRDGHGLGPPIGWVGLGRVTLGRFGNCRGLGWVHWHCDVLGPMTAWGPLARLFMLYQGH